MYKIGIIGDRESTLSFLPLGFSVLEANDADTARPLLRSAAASGEFAVIFITERLSVDLQDEIDRYKDAPLPAITVIPGRGEYLGLGAANIKKAVERAVGADILK